MPSFAKVKRDGLLAWLGGDADIEAARFADFKDLPRLKQGEMLLVWERDATGPSSVANPVLLLEDYSSDDFFAWISTYVSSFRPFSAFFRVLEATELNKYFENKLALRKPVFPSVLAEDLVAVVIVETAIQIGSTAKSIDKIPTSAAAGTLSFALLSALISGFSVENLPSVARAWQDARRITSDVDTRISGGDVVNFWMIICLGILEVNDVSTSSWIAELQAAVRLHLSGAELADTDVWSRLTEDERDIQAYGRNYSGSREELLKTLDKVVSSLAKSASPKPLKDALVGYFIARLANGSADYMPLSEDYVGVFPTAPLWTAFFSVGRTSFDYLAVGQSLGRQIFKMLAGKREFFESPTADVSLNELTVLARSGAKVRTSSSSMTVEVVPFVNARFRASTTPVNRAEDYHRGPDIDIQRARYALDELFKALNGPVRNKTQQRSLFENSNSKKGSRAARK